MKKEVEIRISDISLGKRKEKNPENDRHQYLVIDDFDVNFRKGVICINPTKHHIQEYPVTYCVDCLAEGKRNSDYYSGVLGTTENWYRCKEHYAKYIREKYPNRRCPKCDVGALKTCGIENENMCCTHCDYWKNVRPTCLFTEIPVLSVKEH